MSEAVLKTRAVSVWHVLIFAILCFYILIWAYLGAWPLIIVLPLPLFFLFLVSIIFSKLKVYDDGISFRLYHVYFDEMSRIQLKWGGRLLVFGKLNWYLLLNPEDFIQAVKAVKPEVLIEYREPVKRWKPIIYSIILLAPLMALWGVGHILSYTGIVIDPFMWALVYGITATIIATAWTYWLPPHRYRILGLGRLGTSVAMGLVIGIPVFLIMLTKLFL